MPLTLHDLIDGRLYLNACSTLSELPYSTIGTGMLDVGNTFCMIADLQTSPAHTKQPECQAPVPECIHLLCQAALNVTLLLA